MEVIQIYDTVKKSLLKVKVTPQIANRCKRDPAYTQALFSQVRNKNLRDAVSVKIVPIANAETKDENDDVEKERDFWSTEETKELITIYKTCKNSPECPDSMRALSDVVAEELEKIVASGPEEAENSSLFASSGHGLMRTGIQKTPLQCRRKWAYLLQTYHQAIASQRKHAFTYIQEMADALYVQPKVSIEDGLPSGNIGEVKELEEKPKWTTYETFKFLKVYQKYKNDRSNFPSRNHFYTVISDNLAKDGVFRNPSQLCSKWKNLVNTYRMYKKRNTTPKKFRYFDAIDCVFNDVELPEFDPQEIGSDPVPEGNTPNYSYWTGEETLKLIRFYRQHQPSFRHMPRKHVWELLAAELMSEGFDKEPIKCEFKWKNLVRSYRRNKNNKGSRFYFLSEMKSVMDKIDTYKYDKSDDESQEITDEELMDIDDVNVNAEDDNTDAVEDEDENDEEEDKDDSFERIVIKTEEDNDDSWPQEEISSLIELYGRYPYMTKENSENENVWDQISQEMEHRNFKRTPSDCKDMWNCLFEQYTNTQNSDCDKTFPFYEEMEKVLTPEEATSENQLGHQNLCECFEKKLEAKERRHEARMEMLKRKLDIEDRKVTAFEKYIKYLTQADVHSDE